MGVTHKSGMWTWHVVSVQISEIKIGLGRGLIRIPTLYSTTLWYHAVVPCYKNLSSAVSTVSLTVGTRKGRLGRGKQQLLTVMYKIGQSYHT